MAYRSKISRNRYYGSTFAGRVATTRETPLTDIVDAINRNTGKLERYASNYVEGKKDAADKYLEGYYATGGTPENLSNEILNGKHPELEGIYAQTAIDTHNGRFMAAKAINEIERLKDTYKPFDGDGQTWNEWVSSLRDENGHAVIPSLEGKSKGFNTGFATVFGEYRAQSLVNDAEMRGNYWNAKKQEAGMTYMHTELMTMNKVGEQYWAQLETLNTQLPNVSGLTGKQYYFTTEEMNQLAINHASWILSTATTTAELDKAMSILNADRGTGKGGNPLGSLMNTKRKDVAELVESINNKKTQLTNQGRADIEYQEKQDVKEIFNTLINSNGTLEDRNKAIDAIKQGNFGEPRLIEAVNDFYNKNRFTNTDPAAMDDFFKEVLSGQYESPKDLIVAMLDKGIPTDKLGTALSYWSYWNSDNEQGKKPIYFTDTTYTKMTTNILTSVKGAFTNRQTGLATDGQEEAVMNANNYIIKSIVQFEMDFKKNNNGQEPSDMDRLNFMEKLGKTVQTIFQAEKTPYPEGLKPFTEIEVDLQKKQQEEDEKNLIIEQNTNTLNENVSNFLQTFDVSQLPTFDLDEDTSFFRSRDAEKGIFRREKLLPALTEALQSSFNVENLGEILTRLPQEDYDTMINNLANYLNVEAQDIKLAIQQIAEAQQ
tara:strand:+ start:2198 stop:4168 length:1971 start_codon:yes stop_codon:yes gene_type:complete